MLSFIKSIAHLLVVAVGAVALTLVFFLVLPLMQAINKPPTNDLTVHDVAVTDTPPPPPPPEEKPPEEPEEPEEAPQLSEESAPLDLSQLELALNPSFGSGALTGDFAVKINVADAASEDGGIVDFDDLDQQARVISQTSPKITSAMRKVMRSTSVTVYVKLIIDETGRVANAVVEKSSNPLFNAETLKAITKWRFEPGKKNGKPIRARRRIPITFPKGS
ncbi:TonB family protein [Planctomycetales bacterium ZRK34]|nr:TonB family protein [Planctomycetales bacterium ZRK34]